MRAVVLEKPGDFRIVDVDAPQKPKPGEASVRVRRIGICGTDLHAYQGNQPLFSYPRVMGHELGVEITAMGENDRALAVGDQCALEPYMHCGNCIACRRGKTNCCVHLRLLGVHVDGGMLGELTVPISKLHKSQTLSLDQLALVETLCIGAHAVERANPEPGECLLVIGVGPIGLSVVEFAKQAGTRVVAMDINERRLDFCGSIAQISHCLNARLDPAKQLRDLLGGELPTVVLDCTGSPLSMAKAFSYVAHGGKLVFVGLFPGDVTFHDPDFHRRETTLLSSRNATASNFRRVIDLMEGGKINALPWITHRTSGYDVIKAFPGWVNPASGVIKAIVEW